MDDVTRRAVARQPELWKAGLNWFFRATTQIYTHVMNRPGLGIRSPLAVSMQ